MFRLSGLFSIVIAVFLGVLLFWTSQSVQRAEKNLTEVSRQISDEQENLRVLSAEWDYLNRPERLERLTLNNLGMDDNHAEEKNFVNDISEIPEPVVPVLPGIKPKRLMQNISTERKNEKHIPPVINKIESEDFETLLNEVVE